MNLRWSWDEQTRDLFRWVDPEQWDASVHDPVRLLGLVSPDRLDALAADAGFLRFLDEVHTELQGYLSKPRWFQAREGASPLRRVAYFSPEFGIAEALPQYSGGLGVLAGDHLKAASDLGVPLVGVGLFYKHGYFRQALDIEGWQQERYPDLDPYGMALSLCEGVTRHRRPRRPPAHRACLARRRRPGAALLPRRRHRGQPARPAHGHRPAVRRRRRAPAAPGDPPRRRRRQRPRRAGHRRPGLPHQRGPRRLPRPRAHPPSASSSDGLGFAEAVEAVRGGTVFTTHTPVPAGIDRFPRALMATYFGDWADEVGITDDELMALGQRAGDPPEERFNMAVMGLRLAGRSNAVSKLHGAVQPRHVRRPVARRPRRRGADRRHHQRRARRHVGVRRGRRRPVAATCCRSGARPAPIGGAGSTTPATTSCGGHGPVGRERLVAFIRRRLRESFLSRGYSPSDLAWCDEVLDPSALTICFARRFATYKRATLLLSQPERLEALLLDADRPVQFVFAGKAHPADEQRQGDDPADRALRRRPRDPPPLRVPRGLRHRRRPGAVPGRRRVAEHATAAAGGVRHLGDEGRAQRRPQLLDPRRLVGRAVRRRERLGDHLRRGARRRREARRARRPSACSSCSSTRSCRCSTTGRGTVAARLAREGEAQLRLARTRGHGDADGARLRRRAVRARRRPRRSPRRCDGVGAGAGAGGVEGAGAGRHGTACTSTTS